MVIKVIVTGLPRSGTTITYELIARNNRGKALYLYEPFTPVLHDLFQKYGVNATLHDQLDVTHDYGRIDGKIVEMCRETAYTLLKNPKQIENNVLDVINYLHSDSRNYVIKDLYIWLFIDKILNKINNVKIVFTLRSFNGLYNAFMNWYVNDISFRKRVHASIERVKKMSKKMLIKRIYRIFNVLKWWIIRKPCREWVYGLSPYCKYFNIAIPNHVNSETLHKILQEVYNIYVSIVEKVNTLDNVYVLKLEELQEKTSKVIQELNNFLKPDFEIINYSFVKKI